MRRTAAAVGSLAARRAYAPTEGSTTHFGYREVPIDEKAGMVGKVFHSVADKYDLMNDVLSLGAHRLWKRSFVERADPQLGCQYLDVAGGTGDIAFRIADALQSKALHSPRPLATPSLITVLDINSSMLKVGQDRAKERYPALPPSVQLRFVEGDAQKLPLDDHSIDLYTIAFGIRNVTDIPMALREAHRVLRPGGRFLCLEFSKVTNPLLRPFYHLYNHNLLPVVGHVVASDWDSYQYLAESIERFPSQEDFKTMLQDAGFQHVTYTNYTEGIVAVHDGWKLS
jgi:ubiquinone/menaquinone biosynthesis methyltransferase